MDVSYNSTIIVNPDRPESYSPERILGRGSRSVIYLATCTRGRLLGRRVAIKALALSNPKFVVEVSPMTAVQSLHHPALISLHSSFTVSSFHYLVLELCEGGSLCQLISPPFWKRHEEMRTTSLLTEAQMRPIIRSIIEGLTHLHTHGIVHGDIRPHNVFVTGDGRIKLGGFRHLKLNVKSDNDLEAPHSIHCKRSNYIAPETAKDGSCGSASDLWSLGCMFVTLLTGTCQLEKDNPMRQMRSNGLYKFPASSKVSHQARDLISCLLKTDPQHRITLKGVLSHAFLDPSLPKQNLMKALILKNRNADDIQNIKQDSVHSPGGHVPLTIPHLKDQSKEGSRGQVCNSLSYRMPSVSTPTSTTTLKAAITHDENKTLTRPRIYSASSAMTRTGVQDTWRRLSSSQALENDRSSSPNRSDPLVSKAIEREPRSLNTARKALSEVKNVRRPFRCITADGECVESVPEYNLGKKQHSGLPSGLLSPPEIHVGQTLLKEDGSCDATSVSSSQSTSSKNTRTWQHYRHSRKKEILTVSSTSPYENPIAIPRRCPPKGLQVTPLLPQTYKIAHGQVVILPSRNLLVDLREGDRRSGGRGDRVLCVSPDGQEIKVYDAPHLSTPCVLSEPRESWMLDELPERYWGSYTFASKYLESVKKRTPWMVWYTPEAKFTVMSNGPKGDIILSFPCPSRGLKEQRYASGEIADSHIKMKIKFSRQQDTLELSRYASPDKQRERGEWISKSETITVERLKLGGDFILTMTAEERQGLVCLIEGVKLAEAAEAIYMVARPHIEEKGSTLDDIADGPSKTDVTGSKTTAATGLTPQNLEGSSVSDAGASTSTPMSSRWETPLFIARRHVQKRKISARFNTAMPID